jgi:hypothetical protein
MIVDLLQRVYREKSKGNLGPIGEFNQWLEAALTQSGTKFTSGEQLFSWKIVSSQRFNDFISERETDWLFVHSDELDFILLAKLDFDYANLLGEKDYPRLGSFWLIKSKFEGLQVNDEPIHISAPFHISTPLHRIEPDLDILISRLRDKNVEIIKHVDYKTFRTDSLRIR